METDSVPAISSVQDMMAMVPPDLFADVTDTSGDDYLDTSTDTVDDEPVADEDESIEAPEPDEDEEVPVTEDEETEPVAPAKDEPAKEDELPEGVRKGKDRKGKDGYFLEENRYQTFHGNHKLAQQAAEVLGEPLTMEALQLREKAYSANERLFTNLTSGDPALQGDVVNDMLGEMLNARASGEVGVDPTVPFAKSVYSALKEKSPDGYASLRFEAARDLVSEMFEAAAKSGNQNLFSAAQHFAATVAGVGPKSADMTPEQYAAHIKDVVGRAGMPFYMADEMGGLAKKTAPATPTADQKRIKELESQINGAPKPQDAAAQFATWNTGNVKAVKSAILDDAVMPSLESVKAGWKDFPADYQSKVIAPLHKAVMDAVTSDPELNKRANELKASAQRATSEQVRQKIGLQMKNLYVNRAKLEAAKAQPGGSNHSILKDAAEWLAFKSQQTHERRSSAQSRTAPKGPSAPVRTSVVSEAGFKNNVFDPAAAARMATRAISGR